MEAHFKTTYMENENEKKVIFSVTVDTEKLEKMVANYKQQGYSKEEIKEICLSQSDEFMTKTWHDETE